MKQENIPVVAIVQTHDFKNVAGPFPGVMNFTEDKTAIYCRFEEDFDINHDEQLAICYDPKTDFERLEQN